MERDQEWEIYWTCGSHWPTWASTRGVVSSIHHRTSHLGIHMPLQWSSREGTAASRSWLHGRTSVDASPFSWKRADSHVCVLHVPRNSICSMHGSVEERPHLHMSVEELKGWMPRGETTSTSLTHGRWNRWPVGSRHTSRCAGGFMSIGCGRNTRFLRGIWR